MALAASLNSEVLSRTAIIINLLQLLGHAHKQQNNSLTPKRQIMYSLLVTFNWLSIVITFCNLLATNLVITF